MVFGERLKSLRKELMLSQSDLGKVLGLSCTAISQYESNDRFPDYETLVKICTFFNISSDYLLGQISVKTPPLKEGSMVIDSSGFSGEQLETVRFLIRSFQKINKRREND